MIEENADAQEANLKTLRESAGYTQESLAREMNVSKALIGYYEARKKLPRVDNFLLLAKSLNVSLKTLARAMGMDVSGIPDDVTNGSK